MGARHVLGDHAPDASERLAPSSEPCLRAAVGSRPAPRTSSSVTRPWAPIREHSRLDAQLLSEPPDERRRTDPRPALPGQVRARPPGHGDSLAARWSPVRRVAPDDDDHWSRPERPPSAAKIRETTPGRGRRDLDRRLVGLDLDERVVLGDLLPLGDEPACDLAFGQALAEVGQLELVGHARRFYRIASSRSIACTPLTPFTICVTRRSTTTLESASA